MFSIPDCRHSQKNLLSVYSKKHFSLFKSVTGDHLGFKCKNNLMESVLPKGAISPDSLKAHHKN